MEKTTSIYSPHVLIVEGIFALYDPRVLDLLDMKVWTLHQLCTMYLSTYRIQIFCEADADTCLSRRILRDVEDRGRNVEGVIKQWFMWVKPNFEKVSWHCWNGRVILLTLKSVRRSPAEEWRYHRAKRC